MKYLIGLIIITGVLIVATKLTPSVPEVKTEVKHEVKDKNVKTVRTTVKKPTGEVVTTVVRETQINTVTDKSTSVRPADKYLVQALVGTDISDPSRPIFGVSGSMRVFGPAHVGVWALPQVGLYGVSAGWSF